MDATSEDVLRRQRSQLLTTGFVVTISSVCIVVALLGILLVVCMVLHPSMRPLDEGEESGGRSRRNSRWNRTQRSLVLPPISNQQTTAIKPSEIHDIHEQVAGSQGAGRRQSTTHDMSLGSTLKANDAVTDVVSIG